MLQHSGCLIIFWGIDMDDGFIVCKHNNNIVKVPFCDEMSGYYVDYNEAEIIGKTHLGSVCNDLGILFRDGEVTVVLDSWDGFQPIDNIRFGMVPIISELLERCVNLPELQPKEIEAVEDEISMDFFKSVNRSDDAA